MGRPKFSTDKSKRKTRRVITEGIVNGVKLLFFSCSIPDLAQKLNTSESVIRKVARQLGLRKYKKTDG